MTESNAPSIKRPAFWVLLAPIDTDPATIEDDDADTLHVIITAGDQLRAELEAGQLGLREAGRHTPFHLTALWLWAALVRTGDVTYKFPEFKQRLLAYEPDRTRPEPHTREDAELDELDAHPTAASTS